MNKPIVSFIVPTIRPHSVDKFYRSLVEHVRYPWELILIGPTPPPLLSSYQNVKFIEDFGSPVRCSNIGVLHTANDSKYLINTADDAVAIPNGINDCIELLIDKQNKNFVVTAKYTEGNNVIQPVSYYLLNNAYPPSPLIGNDWFIFNNSFMSKELYIELGGLDCINYNVACMALADLAVRAYNYGINHYFYNAPTWRVDHDPGGYEHLPVERAQGKEWEIYRQKVNRKLSQDEIVINYDNWKDSPAVWKERFNRED